jgi:hypothetical protein
MIRQIFCYQARERILFVCAVRKTANATSACYLPRIANETDFINIEWLILAIGGSTLPSEAD